MEKWPSTTTHNRPGVNKQQDQKMEMFKAQRGCDAGEEKKMRETDSEADHEGKKGVRDQNE